MIDPEDGPVDEMEKWSPDQWRRFFAGAKRLEDIEKFDVYFQADVEVFRQAGFSVVLMGQGAEIDGRVLVSNRKRCWKLAEKGRWRGYADPQEIVKFLATGELVKSGDNEKRRPVRKTVKRRRAKIRKETVSEKHKNGVEQRRADRERKRMEGYEAALNARLVYPGKSYAVCPAVLSELGVESVKEFVERFNGLLRERGQFPVSQGDYPTSRRRFERLLKKWVAFISPEVG